MLVASQASRYAHLLLDARAASRPLAPISDSVALSIADGYAISRQILDIRTASGERMIGRKLGFTNRTLWPKYGAHEPIKEPFWAPVYDQTVRFAPENIGVQSLTGAVNPRIEPEVVFKLGATPKPDASVMELAECIEWIAHGLEIVVSPYPHWHFEAADAIAAFGLHGTLIIGEQRPLSLPSRRKLAAVLAGASVSLTCTRNGEAVLKGAGFGSDVLDNPVQALWEAHRLLQTQPQFAPLQAGEIISTGTWTDAYPVKPGETWTSAFSGVLLPGFTLTLV